jgi:hypothetical protein
LRKGVDHQRHQGGRRVERDDAAAMPVLADEPLVAADRRLGQHDAEEDQHDDRADVDQHLHPGDELRGEDEVAAGSAAQRDDRARARRVRRCGW